jgi:hypothetical protein
MTPSEADERETGPNMTTRDWRGAAAGFLVFMFVLLASRDITRPFTGLHSWDQAQDAWCARSFLDYGLRYTKGLTTMAVGNPPPAVPPWYLDHPQLAPLLDAGAMAILGRNEAALRIASLIATAACLPFLFALLRRLYGEETACLAVFLFIVFPLTEYFNYSMSCWILPFTLLAYWCYLTLIGDLKDAPPPGRRHLLGLGAALFILPQLIWNGLFYAAAFGSHYLWKCFARRRRPDRPLLLTLVLAPAASAAAAFGILVYARPGGWRGLLNLYLWRAGAATEPGRSRLGWWVNQWGMLQKNFTLPVVLIVCGFVAYRGFALARAARAGAGPGGPDDSPRPFVHAWILIVPALLHALLFSGSMWVHNHDHKWFALPIAVAAALGILRLRDWLLTTRARAAASGAAFAIVGLVCVAAARGTDAYYAARNWSIEEIDMFKRLNAEMAPDETLLTYEDYETGENPNKLNYLRPEIAWYLDRRMATGASLADAARCAATGKCPYFLVSGQEAPPDLVERLKARYPWEAVHIPGPYVFDEGDQFIFDLRGEDWDMRQGLADIFKENRPDKAIREFRKVLARNPEHYGGNFQLARALDMTGASREARPYWIKTLELASRFGDAQTAGVARERLAGKP